MIDEFDLPMEIIDRKVTKMKMISPSNREVRCLCKPAVAVGQPTPSVRPVLQGHLLPGAAKLCGDFAVYSTEA